MPTREDEEQQLRNPLVPARLVQDGSVDFYGSPAGAFKTGVSCKTTTAALLFLVLCSAMALYGISYNLVLFMVSKLGLSSATAASQVSIWNGVQDLSPLLVAYISDVYLAHFKTTLAASTVYTSGIALLAVSAVLVERQVASMRWLFFLALYIIALGKGFVASVLAFGADQFDGNDADEAVKKSSYFNWFYFCTSAGLLISVVGIVYVADRFGFSNAIVLCAVTTLLGIATFSSRAKYYRYRPGLTGNPFAKLISRESGGYSKHSNSNLCGVFLVWLGSVVYEALRSQTFSLFVEQADLMETTVFGLRIPPASLNCFDPISVLVWTVIYDRALVPFMRKITGHSKGFTYFQRMGIGLLVMTMAMACAAVSEGTRLAMLHEEKSGKLNVMWQVPQFALIGGSKVFYYVGLTEFVYNEIPEELRTLGAAMAFLPASIGSFLSGFLISLVSSITGWIPRDLNRGHLDYFFWLLVVFGVLNWLFFITCAYTYRTRSS